MVVILWPKWNLNCKGIDMVNVFKIVLHVKVDSKESPSKWILPAISEQLEENEDVDIVYDGMVPNASDNDVIGSVMVWLGLSDDDWDIIPEIVKEKLIETYMSA